MFLILLAVALFAALSYAVTQSARSGGSNASEETLRAQASRIIQIGTQVRMTVQRMRLINSCKPYGISYLWEENRPSSFDVTSAPADKSCHLFEPQGGNLIIPLPDTDWLIEDDSLVTYGEWWFTGMYDHQSHEVINVGTNGARDVLFTLNWLSEEQCNAINEVLGIDISAPPPADAGQIIGDEATVYTGLTDFCRQTDFAGDPLFQYVSVIIPM